MENRHANTLLLFIFDCGHLSKGHLDPSDFKRTTSVLLKIADKSMQHSRSNILSCEGCVV